MKENNNKKILFTANLDSFFTKFLIPQLKHFKEIGYEVHIATKLIDKEIPYCDKKINIDFARSFNLKQNLRSYKQMKTLLKQNKYDIISCHTPFGGAITRLAVKKCKLKNIKIVYMAHGFHFYKGQNKIKYLLFYFAEKYLAKFTNEIITINLDDYNIAKNKFKTNVNYVSGVGLNPEKFNFKITNKQKKDLRKSLGIKEKDFVMIYSAELLERKRQVWLIKTLENVLKDNSNFHLLLPGNDSMNGKCQKLTNELNLNSQIHFLGFRDDISKLLKISDLAVSSSKQEGLPVNVMEAIYCGLPIVATDCRGNKDLVTNKKNGYIIPLNDSKEFCKRIIEFSKIDNNKKKKIKEYNEKIIKKYLLENVIKSIIDIHVK